MTNLKEKFEKAFKKGRLDEANKLADSILVLYARNGYCFGECYAEAKHAKAHAAAASKDYALAQQIMDEVIAIRLDKRTELNNERLGDSYFDRGRYQKQRNIDQAIADMQAAAEAYKKAKDPKCATALNEMAQYYKFRGAPGDADREAECYKNALPYAEKGTPDYLTAAGRMIMAYNEQGKSAKANKLAKQLDKTAKKVYEKEPVRYADFLYSTSVAEAKNQQYTQALEYADKAFAIYEETGHTSDHNYAILLKNTADCHFHLQHYKEALSFYEQASPLLLKFEGEGGKVYQGCFKQLIATNAKLGHTDLAQEYSHKQQEKLFSGVSDTTTLGYACHTGTDAGRHG